MRTSRNGILSRIVISTAAVAALAFTSACGGGSSAVTPTDSGNEALVVAGWGAYFTEATRKNLTDAFTKETGIKVQIVDAPGKYVAGLQSQKRAGKMQWDLLDSTSAPDAFVLANEGLLEPLPADLKSRLQGTLSDGAVTDFGFTFSNLGYVVACRTDKVTTCPGSAKDYFDVQKFPGSREMVSTSPLVNLSLAEMASGVPAKDIPTHDIDLERAFAKLKELKPAVKVWWQSGDQMEQAFRNGEVDMGIAYSGRAFSLNAKGTPMTVVWDEGIYNPGYWSVVKGSANTQNAFRFLEWIATHPEAQAGWSKATGYSVPNPKAFDHMEAGPREQLADWPANKERLVNLNYNWYIKNYQEVNKQWQEFLRG